jgi:hypothetical protein
MPSSLLSAAVAGVYVCCHPILSKTGTPQLPGVNMNNCGLVGLLPLLQPLGVDFL